MAYARRDPVSYGEGEKEIYETNKHEKSHLNRDIAYYSPLARKALTSLSLRWLYFLRFAYAYFPSKAQV